MTRTLFLSALCALFIRSGSVASAPVQVILLGGQSNMSGNGNYDALSSADQTRIHKVAPRVFLSRDGEAAAPLAPLPSKYHLKNRGFLNCFGPEIFIGLTFAEHNPDQEYLLIKVSHGGTALYGAWNPTWSAATSQAVERGEQKQNLKLYSKHIHAIHEQLEELTRQGKAYEIIGMAWMQGENDAAKEISARSYEHNLKQLIKAYRTTFNLPNMPFVCGQINSRYGDFPDGPALVRQAFLDVAASDDHVAVIRTKPEPPWTDFPKHDDQVHYNTEGQQRLSTAMANSLIKLTK